MINDAQESGIDNMCLEQDTTEPSQSSTPRNDSLTAPSTHR